MQKSIYSSIEIAERMERELNKEYPDHAFDRQKVMDLLRMAPPKWKSGRNNFYFYHIIGKVKRAYILRMGVDHYTASEACKKLGVTWSTLQAWTKYGLECEECPLARKKLKFFSREQVDEIAENIIQPEDGMQNLQAFTGQPSKLEGLKEAIMLGEIPFAIKGTNILIRQETLYDFLKEGTTALPGRYSVQDVKNRTGLASYGGVKTLADTFGLEMVSHPDLVIKTFRKKEIEPILGML